MAALDAPAPPGVRRARLAVAAAFLELGLVAGTFGAHLPDLKARADLTNGQVGLVLAAMAAGGGLGVAVSGHLTGRLGARTVMLTVAVLLPLASVGPALAATLPLALAVAALFGVADGGLDVAMNVGGGAVERWRGRPVMNGFHALFSLGGALGAGSAAGAAALGVGPLAHVTGVAVLAAGFATAGTAEFPRRRCVATTPDRVPPSGPVPQGVPAWRALAPLLPVALLVWASQVVEGTGYDWTAVYARDSVGASPAAGGAAYAVFTGAMFLGRVTGDRLTARFGRLVMVRYGSLAAFLGLAGGLLVGGLPAALVGFAVMGLGLATVVPVIFGLASSPDEVASARVLALLAGTGRVAFLSGPVLVGFLAEVTSLRLALGLAAVLSLAAGLGAHQVRRLPGSAR